VLLWVSARGFGFVWVSARRKQKDWEPTFILAGRSLAKFPRLSFVLALQFAILFGEIVDQGAT